LDDAGFDYEYNEVTLETSMEVTKAGTLEFVLEGGHFESELTQLWYPGVDFSFTPKNFHFHQGQGETPGPLDDGSEHTIDGNHFDLEMHIVNLNLDEKTQDLFKAAVIGVLFTITPEDSDPSFADEFFSSLIQGESLDFQTDFVDYLNFNERYVYRGSLTTPPYSESLFWTVLAEPVPISPQTAALFQMPEMGSVLGASNRSVQPINDRQIYKVDISDYTIEMRQLLKTQGNEKIFKKYMDGIF
jgi:carbonic anhydrase